MKFCQPHWDDLRNEIDRRGLMRLVAGSGKEAVKNLTDEVDKGTTRSNFDPLMMAHNAVLSNALNCGAMYLLTGPYCPICEFDKNAPADIPRDWIQRAAGAAEDQARKLGFIR